MRLQTNCCLFYFSNSVGLEANTRIRWDYTGVDVDHRRRTHRATTADKEAIRPHHAITILIHTKCFTGDLRTTFAQFRFDWWLHTDLCSRFERHIQRFRQSRPEKWALTKHRLRFGMSHRRCQQLILLVARPHRRARQYSNLFNNIKLFNH